jgi:hypothetical protein
VSGLLLGPVLRYADRHRATVWVETAAPATVTVTAGDVADVTPVVSEGRTFTVAGHHYALLVVEGLPSGAAVPYRVAVDGEPAWPPPGSPLPAPVIPTVPDDGPVRVAFGSCRFAVDGAVRKVDVLPDGAATGTIDLEQVRKARADYGFDALVALARRIATGEEPPPHLLLMIGDQIYSDEISLGIRRRIRERRGATAPAEQVADYEEYTWLYHESWLDPGVRWLLSTVPSAMIFDDHDVHDDWNTSRAWLESMGEQPWWQPRLHRAHTANRVYQHHGNHNPQELGADLTHAAVRAAQDGAEVLLDLVKEADTERDGEKGYRWSFVRDLGPARLVVVDSRCGRILLSGRGMLGDREFGWLAGALEGEYDHLLLGTSLPWLLPPALHDLEAWDERLAASGRRRVAAFGERLRQARDLEHWAAFGDSFDRLTALLAEAGRARAGVLVLSGDVHHSSVIEAHLPGVPGASVLQVTSSPFRNLVTRPTRLLLRVAWNPVVGAVVRAVARLVGRLPRPAVRWGRAHGPWFGNTVGRIVLDGRAARVRIERAEADGTLADLVDLSVGATGG